MDHSKGMFPVRVLVESVRANHCLTCAHEGQIIADTYTIINCHTQLNNIVDTVLSALGMPHLIQDSRGLIQIHNWKPIPFESITDNQEELAANLFKEISSSITLKILTKHGAIESHSAQCLTQLKDRILKMAMEKQPHFLLQMIDNHEVKKIVQQVVEGTDLSLNESQILAINDWMDNLVENHTSDRKSPRSTARFSPVSEIPLLERWFRSEPNPSRQTLQKHMNQLNNAPYRRSNPKITYQQICNWFTNQRASARESSAAAAAQDSANALMQQFGLGSMAGFQWPSTFANMLAGGQPLNTLSANLNGQAASPGAATPPPASNNPLMTSTTSSSTSQIPLSTQPVDIRSKFDASNAYNPLMDHHQRQNNEVERIDGGSESPMGNDDASVHSASENCGYDGDLKESLISSPELSIDLAAAFSPQHGNKDLNSQQQAAAALAALQQFVPMGLINTSLAGGFSSLDANALSQFAAAAQSQPLISVSSSSRNQHHYDEDRPSSANASGGGGGKNRSGSTAPMNQNPLTPQSQQQSTARSRLMFDPLSELPILERWFEENPHPGWLQIEQYTDSLNSLTYRQNYPPISTHNVKIWFKNRRAKCKRLLTDQPPTQAPTSSGKVALSAN